MEVVKATETSIPPIWAVATLVLICVVLSLSHWRFVTGWSMTQSRLAPRAATRDLVLRLGFAALPGAIACACMAMSLLIGRLGWDSLDRPWVGVPALLLGLVGIASGVWMAKEFYRPTRRRTPRWLANDGWRAK